MGNSSGTAMIIWVDWDFELIKSLLVQIPFCVVIGWPMGTHMDLNFELYETASLFITVLVVAFMLKVRTQISSYSPIYIAMYVWFYLCLPPKVISNKRECSEEFPAKAKLRHDNLSSLTSLWRVNCFGALQTIWMWNVLWSTSNDFIKFTLPADYILCLWAFSDEIREVRQWTKWTDWIAPVICVSIAVT